MSAATITLIVEAFVPIVANFMTWLAKARAASQQTQEWTPEERAANQTAIDKLGLNPEVWQQVQPL